MVVNKLNNELLFKITGGYQQLETLDIEIKNKSENYLKKARQLQNQGQLEEAIATYQQVIKINPDFYQAYINLGEILSELSRGLSSRKVVNEEQFMQVLVRLGFELVTFESMSVFEQAALMAEAEIVVAPHGAGLANLVFCSPGTKVIELFSPAYVNVCYWILSNQCNLEYYYLMGENKVNLDDENLSQGINPSMSSQDIWVNIDSFLNIIKAAKIKI